MPGKLSWWEGKMKHTPGPWHLTTDTHEEHLTWWVDAEGVRPPFGICVVRGPIDNLIETEANARLIAAAPEMYKSLKVALDALGCDRLRQDRLEAQKIIHAAITAAESRGDERSE